MSDEVKEHLFEPFFTTKEYGKGTGLGLAICDGIIRQCGGHVSVYSELGHGTCIKVFLPKAISSGKSVPPSAMEGEIRGGTERILVVEDDDSVRRVVERVLSGFGYDVACASGPAAALELVADNAPFALLLTDVIMKGMPGTELAERLKASQPGLRVLFMSGYTGASFANGYHAPSAWQLLTKPFTAETLARRVRACLDGTD